MTATSNPRRAARLRSPSEPNRVRILVLGIGALGTQVLNRLVWLGSAVDIIACGRDLRRIQISANLALLAAMHNTDDVARVECAQLDLLDIDATTDLLAKLRPNLVVHCATMQPYALIAGLAPEARSILARVGLGPWLPTHLVLVDHLMRAIEHSGFAIDVVNCAYPDAVNPALATVGRSPLIGSGNIANNDPAIRLAIASLIAVEPKDISLSMVMHHYVSHRIHRFGNASGAPFHLSYQIGTCNSDRHISPDRLFELAASRYRRYQSDGDRQIPAASTVSLVKALIGRTARKLHAPGPLGLVGGYPVMVNDELVSVELPPITNLSEAIEINIAAQQFDGIQEIGPDGVVTFTEGAVDALGDVLGHHCPTFNVRDALEWTNELIGRCEQRRSS